MRDTTIYRSTKLRLICILLVDSSLYYNSIFGAIDLEIYGTYVIEDDELIFQPKEDLLQEYVLYGRKNEALVDSLAFNYMQSDQDHIYQLVIGVDSIWYNRPLDQLNEEEIYFKLPNSEDYLVAVRLSGQFQSMGQLLSLS